MTTPDVLAPTAPADLVRQLSAVAEQFGSLLAELRLHADERGTTSEQCALHRLLSGEARADEAVAAGLSFAGARLVVATVPDAQLALRVLAQLRSDKSAVAIWQPPEQLIVLVRGVPHRAGDDRGHRAATRVAALAQREAPGAAVGVSSAMSSAGEVQAAHREAVEAASVSARGRADVVFADESWARVAMQTLVRHALHALPIDNPLVRLQEYDATHGTGLVRTVRTWLANNGDTSATAAALSLHPNSLRYRIRRVQEIAKVDLDDADVRALAHVVFGGSEPR
ncbi:MAG TPA: helix-turn-helix domain-containing protein [Mycobacteriales bacterium]|nr:helix-turn-helix domain-containing protein [Mycobacteriales bacterium]